jgi:hypothetical protein
LINRQLAWQFLFCISPKSHALAGQLASWWEFLCGGDPVSLMVCDQWTKWIVCPSNTRRKCPCPKQLCCFCWEANEMALWLPWLSIWVRIAPMPPGASAVPVAASVISAYWWSALGKSTGLEVNSFCKILNACKYSNNIWSNINDEFN